MLRTKRQNHKGEAAMATMATYLAASKLKDAVGPATTRARENAATAREWASPRIDRARERGVEAAAPRVEAAADALVPKVDAARDKIVDEVLPRLVTALSAGAAAAAAATEAAHDRSVAALHETSKSARQSRREIEHASRRQRVRAALLVLSALLAAGGAAFAAWKRSQPTQDPWAAGTGTSPSASVATSGSTAGSSTAATGDRLSGAETATGLGAGSLASESTDVNTPPPDGVAPNEPDTPGTGRGDDEPTTRP